MSDEDRKPLTHLQRVKRTAPIYASLIGVLGFALTLSVAVGWITLENAVYVPIVLVFGLATLSWPVSILIRYLREYGGWLEDEHERLSQDFRLLEGRVNQLEPPQIDHLASKISDLEYRIEQLAKPESGG